MKTLICKVQYKRIWNWSVLLWTSSWSIHGNITISIFNITARHSAHKDLLQINLRKRHLCYEPIILWSINPMLLNERSFTLINICSYICWAFKTMVNVIEILVTQKEILKNLCFSVFFITQRTVIAGMLGLIHTHSVLAKESCEI